jgi:signal transduction histidine kinase
MTPSQINKSSFEKSPEMATMREKLANIALNTLAVLLLPALIASLWRATTIGWLPIMYMHIVLYAILVTSAILRRRLSTLTKTCVVAGICCLVGIGSLLTFGLINNGILFFVAFCFVMTVLISRKAGFMALVVSVAIILVMGIVVCNEWLPLKIDANSYGKRPSSWILTILAFIPFTAFILSCSRWLIDAVYRYVGKLKAHASALKNSNENLEREIAQRNQANKELSTYRTKLEDLVQERTKSLSETNERLQKEIKERELRETEIKRLNAELQSNLQKLDATNKELETFSYSVSHDLRAPLRTINGLSQIILKDPSHKLSGNDHEAFQEICAASKRMSLLIDGLLSLSQLSQNELIREQVNLSALAKSITTALQNIQPERKVEFDIAEGLIVNGDERQLYVVLQNLLGNAWKFTEKQSAAKIELGTARIEDEDAYFIRDNGAGFDARYADKLFAPFQRLHSAEEFSGVGIGLATVQRIIHRHGGHIWATSEVGKGATFYFTL